MFLVCFAAKDRDKLKLSEELGKIVDVCIENFLTWGDINETMKIMVLTPLSHYREIRYLNKYERREVNRWRDENDDALAILNIPRHINKNMVVNEYPTFTYPWFQITDDLCLTLIELSGESYDVFFQELKKHF